MLPKPVRLAILLLVGATACAGPGAQQPNAPRDAGVVSAQKSVASVKDVMLAITIPTSDAVFKAGSDAPKDAAGWEQVRLQALALAESANLLLIDGRGFSGDEWTKFTVAQRDAALVAMQATVAKDGDALSNASDALYATCDDCHSKYMKK